MPKVSYVSYVTEDDRPMQPQGKLVWEIIKPILQEGPASKKSLVLAINLAVINGTLETKNTAPAVLNFYLTRFLDRGWVTLDKREATPEELKETRIDEIRRLLLTTELTDADRESIEAVLTASDVSEVEEVEEIV